MERAHRTCHRGDCGLPFTATFKSRKRYCQRRCQEIVKARKQKADRLELGLTARLKTENAALMKELTETKQANQELRHQLRAKTLAKQEVHTLVPPEAILSLSIYE